MLELEEICDFFLFIIFFGFGVVSFSLMRLGIYGVDVFLGGVRGGILMWLDLWLSIREVLDLVIVWFVLIFLFMILI